ncbi:restriction endonuclease subunit S [Candidatus Poribacteria bacterium]|nr:restriction endonuclease subunit S [Candidatus Poribacteria bacterium]
MKWPIVKQGDLCKVITKGTTPRTMGHDYVSAGIPFLRAENLQGDEVVLGPDTLFINEETDRLMSRSRICPGDVLLSIAGTIGRGAIVPEGSPRMNCNQAVAIIRIAGPLDGRFLLHWFKTPDAQSQIVGAKVTVTISNLSLGQIKQLKIPLPPLSEQRRIVELLDQADALRKKRTEANTKAERILPALFYKMFGNPVTNSRGWEVLELGDLCTKITSGSRGWAKYAGRGNSIFVRTQDINAGEISTDLLLVDPPSGAEADRTRLCDGNVVITATGVVGKAAVFRASGLNVYVSQHVALVRPKPCLQPEYLAAFANFPSGGVPLLARFQYGQTKPGLGFREIRSAQIPLPPIDLQKQFASHVQKIRTLKQQLRKAQAQLDKLWVVLRHNAFSGNLTAKWRESHANELLAEMEAHTSG